MNSDLEDDISERLEDMKKASFHYNWFQMKMYLGEALFYLKRAIGIKLRIGIDAIQAVIPNQNSTAK